ncbi:uncharacterized protein LOC124812030 [Hydra vulgaris]|uniref:uncharacterized protein LOC124812030 n=1 Tax=Hydra vulgaris TaxID=6087 RepID=UPI001F5F7ECA|nr:cell number regulator 5-like [Hydra vulgaris]
MTINYSRMSDFPNGLCGCNDVGLTCVAFCAPAIVAGKNAEHVGDNCFIYGWLSTTCFGVYIRAMTREKIRKKYKIKGTLCKDLCAHMFCPVCATIQEAQVIRFHEYQQEVLSNVHIVRE